MSDTNLTQPHFVCNPNHPNFKHGQANKTREYAIWNDIKSLCFKKNVKAYKYYGALGGSDGAVDNTDAAQHVPPGTKISATDGATRSPTFLQTLGRDRLRSIRL